MTGTFNRRHLLMGGAAIAAGRSLHPRVVLAQGDGCGLAQDFTNATRAGINDVGGWGITYGPNAAAEMSARADALKAQLERLQANQDAQETEETMALINAVGGGIFFVAGIVLTGPALAAAFTGSVVFAGTMLLADAILTPQAPNAIDIGSVSVNRFGEVAGFLDDPVYGMTGRTAAVGARAAPIIGAAVLGYQIFSAFKAGQTAAQLEQEINTLKSELDAVRATAADMQSASVASEVREDCLFGLLGDLTEIGNENSCTLINLD